MSKQYPGGIISKNPTAPTTASASGIWTSDQAAQYTKAGTWPCIPGAPTIGTASISSGSTTASVTFTPPSDLGAGSITYTATSSPGGLTGTGASPISVSGLTVGTAYTFSVRGATPGGTGPSSAASNSITPTAVTCAVYTSPGTYSWVAPTGVTSVAVLVVSKGGNGGNASQTPSGCPCFPYYYRGGAGGNGGGLAYVNSYSVNPGCSYNVVISASAGSYNYFVSCGTVRARNAGNSSCYSTGSQALAAYTGSGGSVNGSFGGTACCGTYACGPNLPGGAGGAGAAGYSGAGGGGGAVNARGGSGSGGGGGGGGGGYFVCSQKGGGGGGGVGLYGQGSSGAQSAVGYGIGGYSGSCGANGASSTNINGTAGASYGGGGGGGAWKPSYCAGSGGAGGAAAIRIVWCVGGSRGTPSFPSTNVGP